MNPLVLFHAVKWYAIGVVVAVLLVGFGYERHQAAHWHDKHDAVAGQYAIAVQKATDVALKDTALQREIETARVEGHNQAEAENAHLLVTVRADAASAVSAADGLRERYAAAVAAALRQARRNSAAVPGGAPAPDPGDLLADVQRRLDAAAGQLAVVGDERGAAGQLCEREYDSLKTPK